METNCHLLFASFLFRQDATGLSGGASRWLLDKASPHTLPHFPAAAFGSGREMGRQRPERRIALSSSQRHGPPGKPVASDPPRFGGIELG